MRVYPNQLEGQLAQTLVPCYLIFGEETFLLNNAAKQIKDMARKQGFEEIIRFSVTAQFDWQDLLQEYASFSLFSNRKIIEIELGDSKPNAAGGKILKTLSETPEHDRIIIFKGAKVGNDVQRTAWFKALEKIGVFVPCYPLQGKQLSVWIEQQCREHQLSLTNDAKELLIEYNQANLFAISQELEKLSLLSLPKNIDAETLAPSLINQSRLDVFDLAEALLQGHAQKISDILYKLKQESCEPTIILWSLVRESENLYAMQKLISQGKSIQSVMGEFKVWKNKLSITEQALQRIELKQLEDIIEALAEFDLAYKQHLHIDAYQHLLHIALMFVGPLGFAPPFNNKVSQYLNL